MIAILTFLLSFTYAQSATLSGDRILLSTRLGNIAIALYDDEAPAHARQIRALAKAGVLDTTHFFKVRNEFYIQLSGVDERRVPLTKEQRSLLKKLPGEFHDVEQVRGTVTMARDFDNPDSAESSFLILVEDFPALNGKYTAVGKITHGMDTVDRIRRAELDTHDRPLERIEVSARWIPSLNDLPANFEDFSPQEEGPSEKLPTLFSLLMVLVLPGAFLLLSKSFREQRWAWTTGCLSLLVGGFSLFVSLTPMAVGSQYLGMVLLAGSLFLFWVMGRFEKQT